MDIREAAISYYGITYVEHAARDFEEMVAHGRSTVILAITEFDLDFWFPSIGLCVDAAEKPGRAGSKASLP